MMSTLGWVHTIFGLVALFAGGIVIFNRKGTRWHRTFGHFYLTNMIALNATAFFIYGLFGTFGPFHWMAVASLITLIVGMVPVFTRKPKGKWLELHSGFISGSYVGLVAATAAEITSRLPGGWNSFSATVTGISIAVVIGVGVFLIRTKLPKAIGGTPARFRRAQ